MNWGGRVAGDVLVFRIAWGVGLGIEEWLAPRDSSRAGRPCHLGIEERLAPRAYMGWKPMPREDTGGAPVIRATAWWVWL
jgi:hypothetical protein